MLTAVLAGFCLSLIAPWLLRLSGRWVGGLLALLPLALGMFFASFAAGVAGGSTFSSSYPWVPSLGLNLSFYLDGLSLLFVLLICLVGTLVLIYSSSDMHGHALAGRFYAALLAFLASMLGLVLAGNLLLLFVFWELTTITSYMLVGFGHEREEARAGALQALLVTGGGAGAADQRVSLCQLADCGPHAGPRQLRRRRAA